MATPTALILVDAQVNMFEPEPAHRAPDLLEVLERLLEGARHTAVPVVFVRNNGGADDPDYPGTPGWEIHPRLAPATDELIVDKWSPDAFSEPALPEYLQASDVEEVVVAGLQTEFCVRETSDGALSSDLGVILCADGHSTFDGDDPAEATITSLNVEFASRARVQTSDEILQNWTAGHE